MIRTCIGCRQRAEKSTLVRVVARTGDHAMRVVPDLSGAAPGRGAYVHPSSECVEAALRRRAFGRALRVEGRLDLSGLEHMSAPEHQGT